MQFRAHGAVSLARTVFVQFRAGQAAIDHGGSNSLGGSRAAALIWIMPFRIPTGSSVAAVNQARPRPWPAPSQGRYHRCGDFEGHRMATAFGTGLLRRGREEEAWTDA